MAIPLELLLVLATYGLSPATAIGELCVLAGNRLDPSTAEFLSACSYDEYCVSNAASPQYLTCQTRLCRKDEWPAQ